MTVFRFTLYVTLSIVSIGALLYFSEAPRGILGNVDLPSSHNEYPYAVAKNASTKFYHDDGSISYTFQSATLSHFRQNNNVEDSYTTVEQPNIIVFQEHSPWEITALDGRVESDQTITLHNDVTLVHDDGLGNATTMRTTELVFNPIEKLARTEEAVTIASNLGSMRATGMVVDIKGKKIKLLNKVKGHHKPARLGQ